MKNPIPIKHIRYVLPCILLPFSALIYGSTKDSFGTPPADTKPKDPTEINAQLQDPDLEKTQTMNKFDALFDAYEHKEDFSAIKGIEGEEDKNLELDNKDLYSMSEMDKISTDGRDDLGVPKVNGVSNFDMYKNAASTNSLDVPNYTSLYVPKSPKSGKSIRQANEFENYVNTINTQPSAKTTNYASYPNYSKDNSKEPSKTRFDEEMALFKAQMSFIDSMSGKTTSPNNNDNKLKSDNLKTANAGNHENINDNKTEVREIKEVKKAGSNNGQRYFNTLGESRKNSFIKAILDEGLKVYDGSRVRIRLMDDVIVDNTPLSKGSYLFGVISGFATQRVFLTIKNIVYDNRIINVNLDVYDYDGMGGLYIPESLFREITKDAGAQAVSQNVTFSSGTDINATQLAYKAAQDVYRTSTRAMSDAIRRRKAILKYNTMVYLVNKNEKSGE